MDIQIKIIGWLLIVLALTHFLFPKYFAWKKECGSMSQINRQMFYVHSFFIALIIFLMGVLCLTSALEILTTSLGKRISFGLGIFWLTRLCVQFFWYSSNLWRGKRFETSIHILFSAMWAYISAVFLLVYFR
jgi:hypothetical protein